MMALNAWFEAFYTYASAWTGAIAEVVGALPVTYAFGVGMLATVNPCGFVMLPAFAAFYTTLDGTDDGATRLQRVVRALRMGVLVTVAFVFIFGFAGLLIALGGRALLHWAGWAGAVVGVLLIALGAYQLVARRSLFAGVTAGVRVRRARSTRGVVAFGVAYAVCSLGCTLPTFLIVAGSVFLGDRNLAESTGRFVQYALGMGFVLTLVAIGATVTQERTSRSVRRLMPFVEGAANTLLVLAGLYVVWYWVVKGDLL